MLASYGGVATTQTVWQVISLVALASFLGALPHVTAGRSPRIDEIARRILAAAFAAAIFRPIYEGWQDPLADQSPRMQATVMAMVMVAVVLATGSSTPRCRRWSAPTATGRPTGRPCATSCAPCSASARRSAPPASSSRWPPRSMGWWAIPVFCVPLLLTQFSFRRYATIRATYLQTIRSLSRVTEVGGYTESGHARRVSEISVAVGRELGMSEDELLDLEYAALMHDIGQLSLTEPIPGGATVMVDAAEQRRIAENGAAVIRETGVLDDVADIIERQADPYRRPREHADPSLPVSSPDHQGCQRLSTTWSATPSSTARGSTRSSGCAWAWPTTSTRGSSRPSRGSCARPASAPELPPWTTPALGSPASSTRSRDRPCPSPEGSPRGRRGPCRDGGQRAEGDRVRGRRGRAVGDTLVILESMKMEIPVFVEHAGTVTQVGVSEGDVVQEGDVIAVID